MTWSRAEAALRLSSGKRVTQGPGTRLFPSTTSGRDAVRRGLEVLRQQCVRSLVCNYRDPAVRWVYGGIAGAPAPSDALWKFIKSLQSFCHSRLQFQQDITRWVSKDNYPTAETTAGRMALAELSHVVQMTPDLLWTFAARSLVQRLRPSRLNKAGASRPGFGGEREKSPPLFWKMMT